MADLKLTQLPQGLVSKTYYGIDTVTLASSQFADLQIYNVRNYGAKGDGSTSDQTAIQSAIVAAITAPNSGGTVYFPPGNYHLTAPIVINNDVNACCRLLGSSCNGSFISGSISAANGGYLLKIGGGPGAGPTNRVGNMPIQSIEYLNFNNAFTPTNNSVLSTEPANGGCGCLYIGFGIGFSVKNCTVQFNGGFGFFCPGGNTLVTLTNFLGPYNGGQNGNLAIDSVGAFIINGTIEHCKIQTCGSAILSGMDNSSTIEAHDIDIEVSGCGLAFPPNIPYEYYRIGTGAMGTVVPAGSQGVWLSGTIDTVQMESIGTVNDHSGYRSCAYLGSVQNMTIRNCVWASKGQQGNVDYGLKIVGPAANCHFSDLQIGGAYDIAAVDASGNLVGCTFSRINATIANDSGQGVDWIGPSSYAARPYQDAQSFEYCFSGGAYYAAASDTFVGFNGGLNIANLPPAPGTIGQQILALDSLDLAWNPAGPSSNVGKPAGHTLPASGAAAVGATAISFSTSSTWFTGTMAIASVSNPAMIPLGTQGTVSGGTLNLTSQNGVSVPIGRWLQTLRPTTPGDKNLYFRSIPSWLTGTPAVVDTLVAPPNSFPAGTTVANIASSMQLTTSTATPVANATLHFASPLPAWFTVGMPAEDVTHQNAISSVTRVQSFTSSTPSTVTLTNTVGSPGVSSGDTIQFGGGGVVTLSNPTGLSVLTNAATSAGNSILSFAASAPSWMTNGLPIVDYSQSFFTTPAIRPSTTVASFVASPFTVTMSSSATGIGVVSGDTINFGGFLRYSIISFATGSGISNGDTIVFFKGFSAGDATGPYSVPVRWNGAFWEIA